MMLPVLSNFCDYVMFGIPGTFQRVYKCQGPESWWVVCWLFREVGYGRLVSVVTEEKKKRKKLDPRIFLTPLSSSILVRG